MAEVALRDDPTTTDALFAGRVVLVQPARHRGAYRVNVDALLLAEFAASRPWPARAAFDLGAGVGAVGLSLLHFGGARHVTMVEIDTSLARLAEANARANAWDERVEVAAADVDAFARDHAGAADLVVCNPPYVVPGRGRNPRDSGRARARLGEVGPFLDAARRLLGRRARACFIYPADSVTTFLGELRGRGLEPKRLRAVHAKMESRARVVLIECAAGRPGGLAIEPPLVEALGYSFA